MYTQCLDCLTIYKIVAESLQLSHGQFRCGHCGAVFDALPSLTEKLPEGAVVELPRSEEALVPAVLSIPALRPVRQPALQSQVDERAIVISDFDLNEALRMDNGRIEPSFASAFSPPAAAAEIPSETVSGRDGEWVEPDWVGFRPGDAAATPVKKPGVPRSSDGSSDPGREGRYAPIDTPMSSGRAQYDLGSAPSVKPTSKPSPIAPKLSTPQASFHAEVRREYVPEQAASASRWPWVIAACTLALALIVQLGLYQKRALLAHDDFRPALEHACALLGCVLPLRENLDQLKVLDSTVKPHPRVPGALLISASLTNLAPYPQNYPIVEVKLLSLTSSAVALRRFAPTSYLRDHTAMAAGIAANASLPIVFEVIDPGTSASGFEFSFLPGPDLAPDTAAIP